MTTDASGTLRRTALHGAHLALGARMVPFGGFEMPVQYSSILKEHDAVRKRAGLFDLSHMGQFTLTGENVGAWAESLTVNKVANMKPGQARYNIFTNERGGAHDDVIFYRLDENRWLLVVNASNADKMWNVVRAAPADGVEMANLHGERALIAIQGPRSVEWLQPYVEAELAPLKYYACAETRVKGVRDAVVAQRDAGAYPRIVGLTMDGRVPARAGYPVFANGARTGEIRSGSFGPTVGVNVATALVDPAAAADGTVLEVEVRGARHAARVVPLPFYKRPKG